MKIKLAINIEEDDAAQEQLLDIHKFVKKGGDKQRGLISKQLSL